MTREYTDAAKQALAEAGKPLDSEGLPALLANFRDKDAEIERLRAVEKAAKTAYEYHMRGYRDGRPGADRFDANTMLDLLNALGSALDPR